MAHLESEVVQTTKRLNYIGGRLGDLLGLRSRLTCREMFWQDEELNRKERCEYFGIPFVGKPWPGEEEKKIPGNKKAIQKMIAVNQVFGKRCFKKALEDWVHPELKEERKRQLEEKKQRAWAKAREESHKWREERVMGWPQEQK
jgi:hypothetical protein